VSKQPVATLSPKDVLELLPPFPIVLVTTRDNVLTVNQVEYFTFRPLRIGIAIAHSRHSYGLLVDEGEFVVNVPDASLIKAVKVCGSRSGRDGDKFLAAGLDREPSLVVGAVSVAQCFANIECQVTRTVAFEHRDWFIGDVVAARRRAGYEATTALLCGRRRYALAETVVAER
jgi:flavin reductase (DIM6/NTAB) family NADH-FMN oxidoreductase RutF